MTPTNLCLLLAWQEAFGALAAQHLFERGYRRLATVQLKRDRISRRLAGFRETVTTLKLDYHHPRPAGSC